MNATKRPLSLALAALGGQGGGVVCNWLTAVASREGYLVQATSVPGVAQRTGATLYYLEFFAEADLPADGRRPIMALMPSPGDVDVVVATELVEAGRVLQRGLITPDRTILIASTHRAFTIGEKSDLGDGRADSSVIMAEAHRCARRLVMLEMAALAEQHGAIISSVILGAIAGAAGLPFCRSPTGARFATAVSRWQPTSPHSTPVWSAPAPAPSQAQRQASPRRPRWRSRKRSARESAVRFRLPPDRRSSTAWRGCRLPGPRLRGRLPRPGGPNRDSRTPRKRRCPTDGGGRTRACAVDVDRGPDSGR